MWEGKISGSSSQGMLWYSHSVCSDICLFILVIMYAGGFYGSLGGQMHPVAHEESGGSQSLSLQRRLSAHVTTSDSISRTQASKQQSMLHGCSPDPRSRSRSCSLWQHWAGSSESLVHDMVVMVVQHRAAGTAIHFFCIRLVHSIRASLAQCRHARSN